MVILYQLKQFQQLSIWYNLMKIVYCIRQKKTFFFMIFFYLQWFVYFTVLFNIFFIQNKTKKPEKVKLNITPNGITVKHGSDELQTFTEIDRISFCTADQKHEKVFAYIARNKENETMECRAFLCSNRKLVNIN